MVDSFVFSNRAVTALQDSVDQFSTTFDFGVDDLERFPVLSGGAKFPIILSDQEDVFEICYVISLSVGGEATVERAREGTSALSWSAGTFVEHCLTAGSLIAAAKLAPKGEWNAVTNYLAGDVVEYTGISYWATAANLNQVPSSGSTYWQTFYQPPGISSTALSYGGDWNSGTTYGIGAYVKYVGRLWVAIAAGLNKPPLTEPAYWTAIGTPPDPTNFESVLIASGTNNYTVSPSPAPAALYDGMTLTIAFTNANTIACTLAVGALAPVPLRYRPGTEFSPGEIEANTLFDFVYRSGTGEFVAKSVPVVIDWLGHHETRLNTIESYAKYVPVGAVMDFAGPSAPLGWLICAGQAVSRTTYAALFAVIGGYHGTGDGSTTFNVPDLRGRVVAGLDNMGGTDSNRLASPYALMAPRLILGGAGGDDIDTLSTAKMPSHYHGGSVSGGGHEHNYVSAWENYSVQSGGSTNVVRLAENRVTTGGGAHTHAIAAEGGSEPHNNVQPTMVMNKIIFAGA